MGIYYGPNQVKATGRNLALNTNALIQSSRQLAPKQLVQYATGQIPVILPRPTLMVTPGSRGADQPPPLAQRGQ